LKIEYLWKSLTQRRRLRRVSLRHFLIGLFKIDPPRTFNIQYSIENIQLILLVPEARIELARTQGPLDFESEYLQF